MTCNSKASGSVSTWEPEDEKKLYLVTATGSASLSTATSVRFLLVTVAANVLTHVGLWAALPRRMLSFDAEKSDAHDAEAVGMHTAVCRCRRARLYT